MLQGLRPWVPKAPQLSKTGSAISEAGIDVTVLPEEQGQVNSAGAEEHIEDIEPTASEEATAGPVEDTSELVSWDDAEETIEREREQYSDPFVASPAPSAESPFDLPSPTSVSPTRVERLEQYEQWADTVQPEDLVAVPHDRTTPVAAPDDVATTDQDEPVADRYLTRPIVDETDHRSTTRQR